MMPDRPSIPSEIKRSIRQKCNYGCVVCGCPIYQIDHLKKEWHEYHEHDETDMFLLCPTHHTEKTNGLLSTDKILKCFSSINDTTKPHLLNIEKCTLFLGNNKIETFPGVLFNILGKSNVSAKIEDDNYVFSGKIINKDGRTAFELVDNEMILYSDIWDIKFSGQILEFRNQLRDIFLKIKLDIKNSKMVVYGKFELDDNHTLLIKDDGVYINNHLLMNECESIKNFNNTGFYLYDGNKESVTGGYGFGNCLGINKSKGNGFVWDYNCIKEIT